MPVLFGRKGRLQEQEEIKDDRKVKNKEKKLTKTYGKALKMMKNMGFDVDKGIGKNKQGRTDIVHAVKRENNRGLGNKDFQSHKRLGASTFEQPDVNGLSEDSEKDEEPVLKVDSVKEAQKVKEKDNDFLNFLIKTSKETRGNKTGKKPKKFDLGPSDVSKSYKMIGSMKIIDETGQNSFSTQNPNDYEASLKDMQKGFLRPDAILAQKGEISVRQKLASKYK